MDKKSLIGLLLIGVLLVAIPILNKPSKEVQERNQRINDSIILVEAQRRLEAEQKRRLNDTIAQNTVTPTPEELNQKKVNELGVFAEASSGEEKFFYLENKKIRIKFSSKGGRPYSAELKDYKTFDGNPLILFDGDSTHFNLQFFTQNKPIATQDLFFQPQTQEIQQNAESTSKTLVMRLPAGSGNYIDYVYTLEPDSYKLGFDIRMQGMDKVLGKNTTMIDLDWAVDIRQQEKGRKWESQYSIIQYKFYQDDVGKLRASGDNKPSFEDLTTKIEWIGFKQQFFSTVLMANSYMTSARISSINHPENSKHIKTFSAQIGLPFDGKDQGDISLTFYFVPNHYKTLKAEGHGLTILVDLGWNWISWINKWFVINIFHWLEGVIGNYGIIIIILTIFFKLLVFPLSYKSYLSSARMKVLKPQIDEITKKFGADKAMEKQQATMDQTQTAQPVPGMKIMMYLMPVMMLVMFNSYGAGLSLFYFFSNLISYLQQIVIKRSISEEKILNALKENQKKPVKKSKFQERLELMAKERGVQKR
ncbi:MAG: membrane protein insertase YidC [Bacteroidia bacterium]|nr:membrane protein insertase YidC [Bacteroidia bacterium]